MYGLAASSPIEISLLVGLPKVHSHKSGILGLWCLKVGEFVNIYIEKFR